MTPSEKELESPQYDLSPRQEQSWERLIVWLFLLGAMGGALFSVFKSTHTHCHPVSPRTNCAINLGAVARACLTYAELNKSHLPDSLEALTEADNRLYRLNPEQLVCPVGKGRYVYIRGSRNTDDPRKVLACESLENHGGTGANVAYLDGSVRWVKSTEFVEAFVETRAQEDSTPMRASHNP